MRQDREGPPHFQGELESFELTSSSAGGSCDACRVKGAQNGHDVEGMRTDTCWKCHSCQDPFSMGPDPNGTSNLRSVLAIG